MDDSKADQGYLPEYVAQFRFPKLAHLHVIIASRRVLIAMRYLRRLLTPQLTGKVLTMTGASGLRLSSRVLRRLGITTKAPPKRIRTRKNPDGPVVSDALEDAGDSFQERRWSFADGILDEAFHRRLSAQWPKKKFLVPPRAITKSYDNGFRWTRGMEDPPFLEEHTAIAEILDYLRSDAFGDRITKFFGKDEYRLSCYSFLLLNTYPGSFVAAHKDGVYFGPEAKHFMNILFFVDGTGGSRSGGLCLLNDRTYDDVFFETTKLKNTALLYDSGAPFFHGFEPVERGKFRSAIAVQFCSHDYDA